MEKLLRSLRRRACGRVEGEVMKQVPVMSMALNRDHLIELLYEYIDEQAQDRSVAIEALESIGNNSCCETCQEAKLVAREALKKLGVD